MPETKHRHTMGNLANSAERPKVLQDFPPVIAINPEGMLAASINQFEEAMAAANANATACRHFARDGRCPRGDACPFFHESQSHLSAADVRDDAEDTKKRPKRDDTPARAERIAPFDVVWHVHCGTGANKSVAAAWRQKYPPKKTRGPGTGATLCLSVSELERAARDSNIPSTLRNAGGH